MISKKGIIALVAAAVVLLGAYLAVAFLWPDDAADNNISDLSTTVEVFVTAPENIVRMDLTVDGEDFAFALSEDNWVLVGKEDISLKQSSVDQLRNELAGIYAKQRIDAKDKPLSSYGLDNPRAIYKITFADKTTKTFLLGKEDPVTGLYYFKDADYPAVYIIYPSKGEYIYKKADEYKNSNILNVNMETLSRISVTTQKSTLELVRTVKDDAVQWQMKNPMNREADNTKVNEKILSVLSYISVSKFVDEGSTEYAASGVNNPKATVIVADDSGNRQTLYVGNSVDSLRYIKTNGRVYLINETSLSFIETDPFIFINKYISLEKIDDINKIEVLAKDKTYTATIEGKDDNYTYRLNGAEVMETTFKREVYQKLIGMIADEFAVRPVYREPDCTVTFYRKDGTVNKIQYCPYDDRNYAVYNSNGTCEFIIRRKNVDDMLSSLEKISSQR